MLLKSIAAIALAAGLLLPTRAGAEVLSYRAQLDGVHEPTMTSSDAIGQASVAVDTEAQTVTLDMHISGLTLDQLWDHVIHAGMGPVHLHLYAVNGDISLLVPFPYGATYTAAADGFDLRVQDYPYAEGAALLRSDMSFEQFVAALGGDFVYLNVHTDAFNDGEISGRLLPVD